MLLSCRETPNTSADSLTQTNKFLFFEQVFLGGSAALLAVLAAPPHSLRKGSAFPYAVLRIMRLCR